jgi:tetratricopeptide (TPR) repeat protein
MNKTLFAGLFFCILAMGFGCAHYQKGAADNKNEYRAVPLETARETDDPVKTQMSAPVLSLASAGKSPVSEGLPNEEEKIRWLINIQGELPLSHPLALRAKEVFKRVLAAADKRANCFPKLMMLSEAGNPWAVCLKDGTVVLTQQGLEICYQGVTEEMGDSRLAFVLGHELSHLAQGDFWEWIAYETVKKFGPREDAIQEILRIFGEEYQTMPEHVREDIQKRELRADGYGLLYSAMAGYDPAVIIDGPGGKNFFEEWVSQISGDLAYTDDEHLPPDHRAAFLISEMNAVKDKVILFDIGVRLCQLGMYDDALKFLASFQEHFPSREVFNNIGLVHYQMAMQRLIEFDPDKAYQYRLATVLDTETRARGFLRSGDDVFDAEMEKAISNFNYACDQDKFYTPARVNLSSAYIMTGEYAKAKAVLEDAMELKNDDPGILNNLAIARYLDMANFAAIPKEIIAEATIKVLKELAAKHPEFPHARYNLGRMLKQAGNEPDAQEFWRAYLKLEPVGEYAKAAAEMLGLVLSNQEKDQSAGFGENPPVAVGEFDEDIETQLADMPKQSFDISTGQTGVSGDYYSGQGLRVLVLESQVEVVEAAVKAQMKYAEVLEKYGSPDRIFTSVSGKKILVYKNFAVDIENDIATNVVHFNRET